MKLINKFIFICTLLIASLTLYSCNSKNNLVDYASQLKLEGSCENSTFLSNGLGEVELFNPVDGDTAWFKEKNQEIKIRFCSVDTPESTGKIEPWGLKAKNYTTEKLENAASIVLQSEDGQEAKLDSTGTRYVGFVWYKGEQDTEYRNLNLELVQNGYSKNKWKDGNLYKDIFSKAATQALENKLFVFSDDQDPEYDYTSGVEVNLKELNENGEKYFYKRVFFEGLVTRRQDNHAYAQQVIDGKNYGILIYLGYDSTLLDNLSPFKTGNKIRISGFVQKHNDFYQIAGCSYNAFNDGFIDKYPTFCHTLEKNLAVVPHLLTRGEELTTNGNQLFRTLVKFNQLKVTKVYSSNETIGDQIAKEMTITCVDEDGSTVQLRTGSLYAGPNKPITENHFIGKKISSVCGIVDNYKGVFQIRIVDWKDVVIQ